MASLPTASNLVLLQDLPSITSGTKVRFLGCVSFYDSATATLSLQHRLLTPDNQRPGKPPPGQPLSPNQVTAQADVSLLLPTIKRSDISVGAWINVIGYVQPRASRSNSQDAETSSASTQDADLAEKGAGGTEVPVQALILWSAGALDSGAYERVVKGRIEMDRAVRQAAGRGSGSS